MSILGCVFLFYVSSVCFIYNLGGCEYVDVRFGADEWPSTSSLHLPAHQSIQFTSLNSDSELRTHPSGSHHQYSISLSKLIQLWSEIKSTNFSHTLLNSCVFWVNLRSQSQPHLHPFASSASPHFNLQVLVIVFHTVFGACSPLSKVASFTWSVLHRLQYGSF